MLEVEFYSFLHSFPEPHYRAIKDLAIGIEVGLRDFYISKVMIPLHL